MPASWLVKDLGKHTVGVRIFPLITGEEFVQPPLAFKQVSFCRHHLSPRNVVTRVKRLIFDGDVHLHLPKEPRLGVGQTSMEDRKKDNPKTEACM